ncbi:MAG: DnaJ C-terminal domain-containing protein, partial [Chloroflexota bacterium]|nr:DnaJ C-terminal domain-containing protein [Chloroflexota bacterium]
RVTDDRRGRVGTFVGARGVEDFGGMSGFGDIFDAFFGAATATAQRRVPRRGGDLRCRLELSFEEAVFGAGKEVEVQRIENCPRCHGMGNEPGSQLGRCPNCNGTGEVRRIQQSLFGQFAHVAACDRCGGTGQIISQPCSQCGGQGKERAKRRIQVRIPAGVEDGTQVRLGGEGEAGSYGGRPGDLFVVLVVKEHPFYHREGDDLLYDLPLNFAQAALGDEVEVPTLDGPARLKIPAGTQSGKILVLKGKGVAHLEGGGRGDERVKVHIVTPQSLNEEQKRLLRELASSLGEPDKAQEDKGFLDKMKDAFSGGA